MRSRWYELKDRAVALRKKGISIGKVERRLGIPRSTLSGWFRTVTLTQKQKEKLRQNWKNALVKAREKAVLWHNAQKEKRLLEAKVEARRTLENINIKDPKTLELALAILYLGEGSKKKVGTELGSSDPLILNFFLTVLKRIYDVNTKNIKCSLYLRADQNADKMKRFWAKTLKLPITNFKNVQFDQRTRGYKTYIQYKGVCQVNCGNAAIQRKLLELSTLFCKKVIEQ